MPVRITSASGYDAQVDYSKRVSYLTLDVTQENGVGFEEGKNSVMVAGNESFTGYDLPLDPFQYLCVDRPVGIQIPCHIHLPFLFPVSLSILLFIDFMFVCII